MRKARYVIKTINISNAAYRKISDSPEMTFEYMSTIKQTKQDGHRYFSKKLRYEALERSWHFGMHFE